MYTDVTLVEEDNKPEVGVEWELKRCESSSSTWGRRSASRSVWTRSRRHQEFRSAGVQESRSQEFKSPGVGSSGVQE